MSHATKVALTHTWSTTDGVVLKHAALMFSDNVVALESMNGYCRLPKLLILAISTALAIRGIFSQDPRDVKWRGINVGSGVVDWIVRTEDTGSFSLGLGYVKHLYGALRYLYGTNAFMSDHNVVLVLGADPSYYYYSVVAQVGCRHNVPSLLLRGGQNATLDKFSSTLLTGHTRFECYPRVSEAMSVQQREQCLERIDAIITGADAYQFMPRAESARSLESSGHDLLLGGLPKNSHIIFLHDFYDAVSIYGPTIFVDHYRWAVYLINHLLERGCTVFVKLHPNSRPSSEQPVRRLKAMFESRVQFIAGSPLRPDLSGNIAAIYTVYGSVILEAARLGITVVTAGRNPYAAFPIALHAKTKSELKSQVDWVINGGRLEIEQNDVARAYFARFVYDWGNRFSVPMTDLSVEDWEQCFPGIERPEYNYERFRYVAYDESSKRFALRRLTEEKGRLRAAILRLADTTSELPNC